MVQTNNDAPYSWDASDYARHSAAQFAWARELITKLNLKGDETVLDIGCGDGKVTAYLAERLPRGAVVGIDNSAAMIDLAQRTFPPERHPSLAFRVMDAREIVFEQHFDVVFSNAVLHWVKDHRPVLDGVSACLKNGGRLLFQMGGKNNARDVVLALLRLIARDAWKPFFAEFPFPYGFYDPQEYRALLMAAGLEPSRVELIPKDMQQPGRDGLTGWIRTTWLPYTQRIPEDRREDFIAALVETYLAKHPLDPQGYAHVGMVRLEVEACKANPAP